MLLVLHTTLEVAGYIGWVVDQTFSMYISRIVLVATDRGPSSSTSTILQGANARLLLLEFIHIGFGSFEIEP